MRTTPNSFHIHLFCAAGAESSANLLRACSAEGLKQPQGGSMTTQILVIEDNRDNREILRDLLGMDQQALDALAAKGIV